MKISNGVKYNHQKVEKKWQKKWEDAQMFKVSDRASKKKNFYCLDMFPYPSGDGLHVGHLHGYIGSDIFSRYKRLKGFNILHPMGFDAFGLPAENAAIKRKIHPKTWTYNNIKKIRKQLKSIGAMYDWSREVVTSEPEYYKWTQWIFLQLYKKGLAYKAKVPANFCPSCKTVLANEQVVDGRCERCDFEVVQKEIEQWMLRISDYAERLLEDLKGLDWPETTKIMQRNWIGKSEGWEIDFKIENCKLKIPVFTTRSDTLFGCTYLVLAPEHPILKKFHCSTQPKLKVQNSKFVERYLEGAKKKTERERISEIKEKSGVELRGIKAINPVNGRKIPIFVADYVLMHYGTGAIMAVPAHDNRDWDFAKKYNLPIIKVIAGGRESEVYEGEGVLIRSGRFIGMESEMARERIGQWLQKQKKAEKKTYFRLRDWLISRQRYWGAPIPMVFCEKCGWQPVKEKDLPVLLPNLKDFRPSDEGKSPLAKSDKFVKAKCPKCGGFAQRETDTMDTFVCSSWYYLRYTDPKNDKRFADKDKIKAWLPVDMYIGGAEHTVLHLLYSRFFIKALKDMGYLGFKEPFSSLRHQGIILGPDSQKMSKSKGNIIGIKEVIDNYGIDVLRLYEMFIGPFSETASWSLHGIKGCARFLEKAWELRLKTENQAKKDYALKTIIHKTIKKVTEDIESFKFNTAISALMILSNNLDKRSKISLNEYGIFLRLLFPFAPHLAEELWQNLGRQNSIHNQKWPKYDAKITKEEKVQLIIQINGRVRDKIEADAGIVEQEARGLAFSSQKVQNWLGRKKIKKVVFVPDKLINIVV